MALAVHRPCNGPCPPQSTADAPSQAPRADRNRALGRCQGTAADDAPVSGALVSRQSSRMPWAVRSAAVGLAATFALACGVCAVPGAAPAPTVSLTAPAGATRAPGRATPRLPHRRIAPALVRARVHGAAVAQGPGLPRDAPLSSYADPHLVDGNMDGQPWGMQPEEGPHSRAAGAPATEKLDLLQQAVQRLQQGGLTGAGVSTLLQEMSRDPVWKARRGAGDGLYSEISALCDAVTSATHTFAPAHLVRTTVALVRLCAAEATFRRHLYGMGYSLITAISRRAMEVMAGFTGPQCAALLWGFAKIGIRKDDLIQEVGMHVMNKVLPQLEV